MCECNLLVERNTGEAIEIADDLHSFTYVRYGKRFQLLDGIKMNGTLNYAAAHEISDSHGVKRGYMFIVGER